jgi:pimeloyl-ACP methyl ester carboxylesterase
MVGQTITSKHPELVASLSLAGSLSSFKGWHEPMDEILKRDFINVNNGEESYELFRKGQFINFLESRFGDLFRKQGLSTRDILAKIDTPTLIVAGNLDIVVGPEESREMHSQIQNSQLYEISEAGHLPNMTHPQEFNGKVIEFINAQEVNVKKKYRRVHHV